MPYTTRLCAVFDIFTPIVYHVIQRELLYNMVSDDVAAGYKDNFSIKKLLQRNLIENYAWGRLIIIMMFFR